MPSNDSEDSVLRALTKWSKQQKLLNIEEEYELINAYQKDRNALLTKYKALYAPYVKEKGYKELIKSSVEKNLLNPNSPDYSAEAKRCMDILITKNLRLVLNYCKRSNSGILTTYDLFVEGLLGMIHAINKFNTGSGNKFSTYAVWWIRQSIQRAIQDKDRTIRIPIHVHDLVNKIRKSYGEYSSQNYDSGPPDSTILSRLTGIDKKHVEKLGCHLHAIGSIDEVSSSEDDALPLSAYLPASDKYSPTYKLEERSDREKLIDLLQKLGEDDCKFMMLYFGFADNIDRNAREMASAYKVKTKDVEKRYLNCIQRLREIADPNDFNF